MADLTEMPVFKKIALADVAPGNKKRLWKSLKQILAHERTLQWPENSVTCKLQGKHKQQGGKIIIKIVLFALNYFQTQQLTHHHPSNRPKNIPIYRVSLHHIQIHKVN